MMFYFQSGQLGHSTNTIILKVTRNEHKSYASVFSVICTFQSSQFFDRLSMHFGVVDHIRASAPTTADRRLPSWNRITDSTHAPPVRNGIGEPHWKATYLELFLTLVWQITQSEVHNRNRILVSQMVVGPGWLNELVSWIT